MLLFAHFPHMAKKKSKKKQGPKKKDSTKGGSKLKKILKRAILAEFREHPEKTYNYKQLASRFEITDAKSRTVLNVLLEEMARGELIRSEGRGKYGYLPGDENLSGTIQITSKGSGFVTVDSMESDVYIPPPFLKDALDGDTVAIQLLKDKRGRRPEGEVTEVLQRHRDLYVGVTERHRNHIFVRPDNKRIHVDFFIPSAKASDVEEGQKVIVRMESWPSDSEYPLGEIIDLLGEPGLHEVEMNAIMVEFGLPLKFPSQVEQYAANLPIHLPEEDIKKRRDFRDVPTFTIDPDDAKDFDDALSFRKLENGNVEVGVHIADVSYYVQPESPIEKEAYTRATSVYLVDRVIPMLPEILSNKVCSLRPDEEKFAFSAVFEMNENTQVLKEWFGRTVILSTRRFTYDEAQEVIETGKGDMADAITWLQGAAVQLRKERIGNGALEIEGSEVKFELDDKGNPVGVRKKVMKDANKLIEEFMLLANRRVAQFLGMPKPNSSPRASVYRIHEPPDPEKLQTLLGFLKTFGIEMKNVNPQNAARHINKVLQQIKGKPEEHIIRTQCIRTMSKAVYATDNLGHYGLAFEYYTHFTSPIRRYPDLMVHRLLQDKLDGKPASNAQLMEKACLHSSEREKVAAEAERASIKYKQVQFLEQHLGEVFPGMIISVVPWGFFVELEDNYCEGLVRMDEIDGDHYYYDSATFSVRGKRSKKVFTMGDNVEVQIDKVDLMAKEVTFALVYA